jgi:hypothetical protein
MSICCIAACANNHMLHCSTSFFFIMPFHLPNNYCAAQTRGQKPQTKLLLVGSIRIALSPPTQTPPPPLPPLGLPLQQQRPSNGELGSPCCRMPPSSTST